MKWTTSMEKAMNLAAEHLVLPCKDVFRKDFSNLSLFEVGEDLGLNDMFLGFPGIFLDPLFHIFGVDFNEAGKGHIQFRFQFACVFSLPCQGFPFGSESTLLGLLGFPGVVCVTVDHTPGVG